ncbi:MAG: UDP-3-O-acyl-N-acetylglucosamine deacetylase [Myxococcota bacterium]
MKQRTLSESVSCTGIGLHTGSPVQLTLRPGPIDSGVVFVRADRERAVEIRASPAAVVTTSRATTLGSGDATVGTVEHLFAALFGLGIDNIRVEVRGPELPIMDGSAAPFVYLLRSAGIVSQWAARRFLRIRKPIEIRDGDRHICIEPCRSFRVSYAVDYDHPAIGRQEFNIDAVDPTRFEREVCSARTFGFMHEVQSLLRAGFARGGSLENTVVLNGKGVVNEDGLRWPDEFVRHKVLDLFGDLALLGLQIRGHVRVERGGHSLHQRLVAAIVDSPSAWRIEAPGVRMPRSLGAAPASI